MNQEIKQKLDAYRQTLKFSIGTIQFQLDATEDDRKTIKTLKDMRQEVKRLDNMLKIILDGGK